jgi:S1-C subfamily serine protease
MLTTAAVLGNSKGLKVGQLAIAVGIPLASGVMATIVDP